MTTNPVPSDTDRPRNQHCMNCGDTRGGPMGHETHECTYDSLPDKASYSGAKLQAAVQRHNEQLSPDDRAAIKDHAARILDREARVDALAAAIGRPRVKPAPDTDRIPDIAARLKSATEFNPLPWTSEYDSSGVEINFGPTFKIEDASGDLVFATDSFKDVADLLRFAPDDLEYLLAENERLRARLTTAEGQLATARKYQLAAVVSWYVAWQRDAERVNNRPSIAETIANHSEGRFRGALAAFQDLLIALGEIEGDEECEAAWQIVESEMESARALGLGEGDSDA